LFAKPLRLTGRRGRSPQFAPHREFRLHFLLKCAFWLSIVLIAISWSRSEVTTPLERPVAVQSRRTAGDVKKRAAPKSRAEIEGFLSSASRRAADRLADEARRRCLEIPQDCVDAIDFLREGMTRGIRR
jgi:hypothetical protein